jgi:hypothetical protein
VNADFGLSDGNFLKLLFFSGEHKDFSLNWYTSVGAAMMITLILNIVTPHAMALMSWCCLDARRRKKMRNKAVTQRELNLAYEGSRFSIESRYSTLMVALICCFTYASGMPLLIPTAMASFFTAYWMDKISLLRVNNRPPNMPPALAQIAVWSMVIGAVLHLCMSIWMFGSDSIFKSETFKVSDITGAVNLTDEGATNAADAIDAWLKGLSTGVDTGGALAARLTRFNTIPQVTILFLMACGIVLYFVFGQFLATIIGFLCNVCLCGRCGSGSARISPTERRWIPAYTDRYFEYEAPHDGEGDGSTKTNARLVGLSDAEITEGWRLDELQNGRSVRVKQWTEAKSERAGEKKRTWEVMRDTGCHSYDIEKNPKYV